MIVLVTVIAICVIHRRYDLFHILDILERFSVNPQINGCFINSLLSLFLIPDMTRYTSKFAKSFGNLRMCYAAIY